jgi:hypothetical protein
MRLGRASALPRPRSIVRAQPDEELLLSLLLVFFLW